MLLIDRNLDLSMGSLYHDETVFDKITNMMPGLSLTSNDVRVDLQKFLFDNKYQRYVLALSSHLEVGFEMRELKLRFRSVAFCLGASFTTRRTRARV